MALLEHWVTVAGDNTDAQATYNAAAGASLGVVTPCSLTVALKYAVAGDRVNICGGTYTRTAADTLVNAGTVGSPIVLRGVAADGSVLTVSRTNGNGPLVTTGWPVLAYNATYALTLKNYMHVSCLSVTGTINNALLNTAQMDVVAGCSIVNAGNGGAAMAVNCGTHDLELIDCDLTVSGTQSYFTIGSSGGFGDLIGCRFSNTSTTTNGHVRGRGFRAIIGCTFRAAVGYGVDCIDVAVPLICGCTFYSQTLGAVRGQNAAYSAGAALRVINCTLTDSARALLNQYNATAAHPLLFANNRTRDNTQADLGFGDWPYFNAVTTDTGGPETDYVDAANGDFRLIASSPARGAGLPAYSDIGACQRYEPTNAEVAQAMWEYANRTLTG